MSRKLRTGILTAAALVAAASAMAPAKPRQKDPPPDPRAQEVFERTKRTEATYSLYSWHWREGRFGPPIQHWAAEFHSGSKHRVETPEVRVIADCAARTGTVYFIAEERSESAPAFAAAACGINANVPIRRLEWLGRKESRFGPVDTIRIVDVIDERTYAVDQKGVLVGSEYSARDPARRDCVKTEPLAYLADLPAGDAFSEDSLRRSLVPERYRQGPAAPVGDLWVQERSCAGASPGPARP
jgi:hypothetical protein